MEWTQGTTHLMQTFQLLKPDGTALSLVGRADSDVTLRMRPDAEGTTYATLQGSASITDAANGIFIYQFVTADVALAGYFQMVISVNYGTADPVNSGEFPFTILGAQ